MAETNDINAREIWKSIPGYEGYYEVSNCGRVRSLDRIIIRSDGIKVPQIGKLMRTQPTQHGRRSVMMCGPGLKTRRREVHRMVLEAFVGPCPENMEACHRDDDCTNNHLENLRWDTKRSNMQERDRNGKTVKGQTHGNAKLTDEGVREMRRLRETGAKLSYLSERYGIAFGQIGAIVRREAWKHVE
jgi:hypothetical protein